MSRKTFMFKLTDSGDRSGASAGFTFGVIQAETIAHAEDDVWKLCGRDTSSALEIWDITPATDEPISSAHTIFFYSRL